MARWKLMTAHYLNCPGTEWEYNENSRSTGKPQRRRFQVPRYLDPRDPSDWTSKWGARDDPEGEIIVCFEGRGQASDVVFTGDPTPDMLPMDDEAREISATYEDRWRYKPDTAEVGYSQTLVDQFQSALADAQATQPQPLEVPGLTDLVASINAMVASQQQLLAASAPRFTLKSSS